MKKSMLAVALGLGWATTVLPAQSDILTTHREIHSLTNAQASHQTPVRFEATVTFYRDVDVDLFVQDQGDAIYVNYRPNASLSIGDGS